MAISVLAEKVVFFKIAQKFVFFKIAQKFVIYLGYFLKNFKQVGKHNLWQCDQFCQNFKHPRQFFNGLFNIGQNFEPTSK